MLSELLNEHRDIVASWSVTELDHEGPDLRLKAHVVFSEIAATLAEASQ